MAIRPGAPGGVFTRAFWSARVLEAPPAYYFDFGLHRWLYDRVVDDCVLDDWRGLDGGRRGQKAGRKGVISRGRDCPLLEAVMRLLVTGGAGYIGTHLLVELLQSEHEVVVLDDLSTGCADALARAEAVAGRACHFVQGSITDAERVDEALQGCDVVLHLAALKLVGESVKMPGRYFSTNVGGMATLVERMDFHGVRRIVFSSSAAVYGPQTQMPLREDAPLQPSSPYGVTKRLGEQMLSQMATHRGWSAVSLRYFNPVGAHSSGLLGEPLCTAASLVPRALCALLREDRLLTVFGTDYPTADGTCERDYVHVVDVARAHLVALSGLERPGHQVFNIGTGRPASVREVLVTCERVAGRPVPHIDGDRRVGDIPVAFACCNKVERELGFRAKHGLDEMVASAWRWSSSGPRAKARSQGEVKLTDARQLWSRGRAWSA